MTKLERGNATGVSDSVIEGLAHALQLDEDLWVLHAFRKKSKTGIKTPKQEINLIRERIRRITEQLS